MPYVNIKITREGATPQQKARLIEGATTLLVDVLNKDPQTTVVVIDEVDIDNWGIGGESVSVRRSRSQAPTPQQPVKLYRAAVSGHCHRVELMLSLLGVPVDLVDINLAKQEQKSPQFLTMNPFGQVPVLQDGDVTLADSNAMLVYLCQTYGNANWLPRDPVQAAKVQSWLSVAAGLLAFGPAAARARALFGRTFNAEEVAARAQGLFAVMEQRLAQQPFLLGAHATIADVANYSYIARAPEGGLSLESFPAMRAWLARIEALPGFVPMVHTAPKAVTP